MPTKRYTKRENPVKLQSANTLPVDRPIAVYYRQSSAEQVGNVSTSMQQVDLPAYVESQGWQHKDIILIADDEGISGKTAIDERIGMTRLYDLICEQKIGAVAVIAIDRLFRDKYLIGPGKFLQACTENQVWIIVPDGMPYVFHDPVQGSYHSARFLTECTQAANYLDQYIAKRMHGARNKMIGQGCWQGFNIPPGFMIGHDFKYLPFEPAASVVYEYFKLFVDRFTGNVGALADYIAENGPDFPYWDDPELKKLVPTWNDPIPRRGIPASYGRFKPYSVKPKNGRYYPSVAQLRTLFTNAAYIGHWAYNGQLIKLNNHPAIVPEDLFYAAFNYISPVTLTGDPNPDYHPRVSRSRETDNPAKVQRPFVEGLLYSPDDAGNMRSVTIEWSKDNIKAGKVQQWYYLATSYTNGRIHKVWRKQARQIDELIHRVLQTAMASTVKNNAINDALESNKTDHSKERRRLTDLLAKTERQMKNVIDNLATVSAKDEPDTVDALRQKYKALGTEKSRLQGKIDMLDAVALQDVRIVELRRDINHWQSNYLNLSPEEKNKALHVCIRRIEAVPDVNDLRITVYWNDDTTSEFVLPREGDTGWTNAECKRLVELVDAGADQLEIAAEYPQRQWRYIHHKYWKMTGKSLPVAVYYIHKQETYEDYLNRTADYPADDPDDDIDPYSSDGSESGLSAGLQTVVNTQQNPAEQARLRAGQQTGDQLMRTFPHIQQRR